jgi:hypothetical protein
MISVGNLCRDSVRVFDSPCKPSAPPLPPKKKINFRKWTYRYCVSINTNYAFTTLDLVYMTKEKSMVLNVLHTLQNGTSLLCLFSLIANLLFAILCPRICFLPVT